MDDNKQPVSLARLYTIVKERNRGAAGEMLHPEAILQETERSIKNCGIKDVSERFKDTFREYVETHLVNEIARIRESFGLKSYARDGLSPAALKRERSDAAQQD